jgi:syntaxin 1B/2/3
MASLVDQQGDVIDSIESQVAKSTEYVARGKASLVKARSHQRSARVKKLMVVLGIAAIVAIIACAIAIPSAIRAGR